MTLKPLDAQRMARFSVDQSAEPTMWIDASGHIEYANAACGRVLGCETSALIGHTFFDIAPELNPDLWRELWKEVDARGAFSFEFTLQAVSARAVSVGIMVHRLEMEGHRWASVFFHDVEEKKRLKTLEQEFVSTVSHELRTPLTVIREGVSQVLDGLRGAVNESQTRALSLAMSGIDRLGRMIEDLLDLSKMEAGKIPLKTVRCDLPALVREVTVGFQSMAAERGIKLEVRTPAGPVVVFADRDRLIQVLTNVINNAFKFTERGCIEVAVELLSKTVSCSITDTGMGFRAEDAQRIFDRFEQLESLAVTGEKGTGLGLSICRSIVELHQGRIEAQSQGPGTGSRFTFELPRREARDVFREKVAELLQELAARGGTLSVMIFELVSVQGSVSESDLSTLVEGLENLVRQQRGRKNDILIKDARALYVALPSTVGREAARISERIQKALVGALQRDGLADRVKIDYALTSYPEEADQEEHFLDKALPQKKAA